MAHVDLHLHTTYSDGTLSPEELVAAAADAGVTLIAITDHDEIDGIISARRAAVSCGVTVISGVEINTDMGREDVHILGYGFPADSDIMHAGLESLRRSRLERALKIVERLAAIGRPISVDRMLEIAGHGSIGRPHIARAIVEAGHAPDAGEAFDRFIGRRGPAYIARAPYLPQAAIHLIHAAGGITSLAHPAKLGDPLRIIRLLKDAGLDALEAYHSDHTPAATERMLAYARRFNLGVTGGSDSHGPHNPRIVRIGSAPVPDTVGTWVLEKIGQKRNAVE